MIALDQFFENKNLKAFEHARVFDAIQNVWDPLMTLDVSIRDILSKTGSEVDRVTPDTESFVVNNDGGLFVSRWIKLGRATYFEKQEILIGAGTTLEPSAIIKGPCIIGNKCEVRQGAYLRGNILVGDHCTLGHATEIKNSILMNHTEAGHFNYVGDSILGSYVNLGAGSKLANLQFRSEEEKKKPFIHKIRFKMDGKEIDTGMEKLGSILGDYAEIGCNAALSPATFLAHHGAVYPNFTVPKGYYPPHHMLKPQNHKPQ